MNYDIDEKIEETALMLSSSVSMTLEELQHLLDHATNQYSRRVFLRAIELRTTTEELCPDMTSR